MLRVKRQNWECGIWRGSPWLWVCHWLRNEGERTMTENHLVVFPEAQGRYLLWLSNFVPKIDPAKAQLCPHDTRTRLLRAAKGFHDSECPARSGEEGVVNELMCIRYKMLYNNSTWPVIVKPEEVSADHWAQEAELESAYNVIHTWCPLNIPIHSRWHRGHLPGQCRTGYNIVRRWVCTSWSTVA